MLRIMHGHGRKLHWFVTSKIDGVADDLPTIFATRTIDEAETTLQVAGQPTRRMEGGGGREWGMGSSLHSYLYRVRLHCREKKCAPY